MLPLLVMSQLLRPGEPLFATFIAALKGLDPQVGDLVLAELRFGHKRDRASGTLEGFLSGVRPNVCL